MLSVRTSKNRYPFVCTFAAGFIIAFGGSATASGKEKVPYAFAGGSDGAKLIPHGRVCGLHRYSSGSGVLRPANLSSMG